MTIKIDLKNRPPAPFDFPHRCFEMSHRIQAATEALSGADPWGNKDQRPGTRQIAYMLLRSLVMKSKAELGVSSEGYEQVLQLVLDKDYISWRHSNSGFKHFWPPKNFLEQEPVPDDDFSAADLTSIRTRMLEFGANLEKLGLYFLRMLQAQGHIKFDEVSIVSDPPV